MAVSLCVLLWPVPGSEALLVDYEDRVLARLDPYGARVVQRVRGSASTTEPFEVQLIEFPTQAAYDSFLADPERLALADLRVRAVARTEIIPVRTVLPAASPPAAVLLERPAAALPDLVGPGVTVRPGTSVDVAGLIAVMREPSVARWWNEPEPPQVIGAKLRGESYAVQLVIEVDGELAGGIEFLEEEEPDYRHASIDVFVTERWQGQGVGAEAVGLLARYLISQRGHHRLTIDPAASNAAAIGCYRKVGFRPVGVLREYERGADGTFHDGLLMDLVAAELAPEQAWLRRR